jgi:predicted small lipoprotein YifL
MQPIAGAVLVLALAGCGDKVPASDSAKKIGSAPRQAVDRATQGVNEALQKDAERAKKESD